MPPLLGPALELRCQNLTVPLAVRRPRARFNRRLGLLVDEELAAPVAPEGDQGGAGGPGRLLLEVLPGPPSPGRRSGAAGGRQPPSSASAPELHCQNLTAPWPTEDPGLIHAAVGVPLSKFDSPFAGRRPGPAPCLGTQKRVTVFVAPPFAPVAVGDAGDPGAPTQVFSVPIAQAHRPALVAAPANVRRHADRVAVRGATAPVRQTDRANPSMAVRKSLEGASRPGLPV